MEEMVFFLFFGGVCGGTERAVCGEICQEIYGIGGRKFGFINLPPLGCLPGMRIIEAEKRGRCLEKASSLAKLHNHALSKHLVKLEHQLVGFKYSLYDFNSNLRKRMNHPHRYGENHCTQCSNPALLMDCLHAIKVCA